MCLFKFFSLDKYLEVDLLDHMYSSIYIPTNNT